MDRKRAVAKGLFAMIEPILITGCARSGTSMTAGIINACGANGGDMFGPNRHNKRGMFENKIMREGIVKPYLRSINACPRGQKPLPDMQKVIKDSNDAQFVKKWRNNVLSVYTGNGVDVASERWFYKGAKMCLFWPIWYKAFKDAKWVIVRRQDSDIINSCFRTSFMNSYQSASGWQSWIDEHKKRFEEMKTQGLNVFEFWPQRAISGDLDSVYEMIDWLELEPNKDMIENFIDPVLWKGKHHGTENNIR